MTERSHLSEDDVHAVLRMVAAVPPDSGAEVEHRRGLFAGLAELVGADAWVWTLERLDGPRSDPVFYAQLDGGWTSESQRVGCLESSLSPEIQPLLLALAPHRDRHASFTRSELVEDAEWYASEFYLKHREPTGLDDLLLSLLPVNAYLLSILRVHRFAGRALFGVRERAIVHAVMGSVDWLHRIEPPGTPVPPPSEFSRREREVLALLVAGLSKKQVASELGLSEHTVGDYTKALYRHFNVHSRGELLARFIRPS